ncbi:unnamed protein product [Pseudo-nitzschia multistriata]|uniref:DNA helicase n=1 Tax=Pseudo-nitzschia multistriata TaxID=183589 RepID=A0A448ZA37_9STRA|nr:unnamed protein product [Pseudo-nitzschia multistriata]
MPGPSGPAGSARGHPWTAERLCRASYQELGTPAEVENLFKQHLLSSCRSSLEVLLSSESRTTRDYSLEIDAFDLFVANPVLGHLLLKFPNTLVPLLEKAIVEAQNDLLGQLEAGEEEEGLAATGDANQSHRSVKGRAGSRVHARIFHLPPTCSRTSVASQATDVGKIVQLSGTVVRTSAVQMYESARTYRCAGKNGCSGTFVQEADLEQQNNAMVVPERCPLFSKDGKRCSGTNLKATKDGSVHTDYQEIKIQESASKLGVGSIPRSLLIKLQHDLVDSCQPGDEVVVVGILLAQWQQAAQPGLECQVGMALKAHSVRVTQENGGSAFVESSVGELDKYKKEFDVFWDARGRRDYPIASRDFICTAVCPKLYGLQVIKLALLITLIGGVSSGSLDGASSGDMNDNDNGDNNNDDDDDDDDDDETDACRGTGMPPLYHHAMRPESFRVLSTGDSSSHNGNIYGENAGSGRSGTKTPSAGGETIVTTRRRDMSHMLLIGDPGTGKSQVLRFAAALCPRSVLTTGVGTTSAGLTCAAVREGNGKEFALEAGALVLADKGICCIDEFGCIRNEDRTTIHEAMEQQTLSIAKAGIVCKLNCRATVIAVMNPRNCIYDNHMSLAHNTGLGTPLLSRFDLIFKLVDSSDAERDSNVTTYLLNRAIQGTGFECSSTSAGIAGEDTPWSMEKLRAYIAIVKDRFQPSISDEAARLLEAHYEKVRSAQSSSIPVTVRFLESLIRLSQAHARLMYRNTVHLEDAVAVLRVMECSAHAYGGFDGNVDDPENILYGDPMHMDTCVYAPDEDFVVFEYSILKRYDMLEYMSNDLRNQALALLEGEDDNDAMGFGPTTWNNIANPHDRPGTVGEDHYGRSYFSPGPPSQSQTQTPNTKRRKVM